MTYAEFTFGAGDITYNVAPADLSMGAAIGRRAVAIR
jgi:hypothetical protein